MAVAVTPAHAAHLLTRAAWVATPDQLQATLDDGIEATVDRLLDPVPSEAPAEPAVRADDDEILYSETSLTHWFFDLAVSSTTPAIERLLWFWHGHFATSVSKVEFPSLMFRQFTTLRDGALGDFESLIGSITNDVAMNLWLDLETNVSGALNENYARELLELFTMGVDNGYSQTDVVELARIFTGLQPNYRDCDGELPHGVRFDRAVHDSDTKTFLGQTGTFVPDDALGLIAARPETHAFIAERLWHRYAGTAISPTVRSDLAAEFARTGSIRALLGALLTHPAFYTQEVRDGLVAAPVESLVRAYRGLGIRLAPLVIDDEPDEITWWAELMGQVPARPPHVGGWPHNHAWIDAGHSATRARVGRELGWHVSTLSTPPLEEIRAARDAADFRRAVAAGFGVLEWSSGTTAALNTAYALPSIEDRLPVAIAAAFSSPEVTLS